MIVDAHCHVWPDHIAAKVLAARPADLDPVHDGTIAGLRRTMAAAGVDHAMCLGVANVARTVERTNEFIGSLDRSRFTPFGTVHPDLPVEVNLKSLRDNGIRGVKLHPMFQDLSFADPRVIELLAALAGEGITVIAHVGEAGEGAGDKAAPRHMRAALDQILDLTLITCHFGGYHRRGVPGRVARHPGDVLAAPARRPRRRPAAPDRRPARRGPGGVRLGLADGRPGRGNRRRPLARPGRRQRAGHPRRQPGPPAGFDRWA